MTPASSGAVPPPSANILPFSNSWLALLFPPCWWFSREVPYVRSMEVSPPGALWSILRTHGALGGKALLKSTAGSESLMG
ncbi:hypothetical protein V6N13_142572 [Hibiscus sabdariffa]|uniref:Uncharacterized protein n=1 Tax=Hibiscus sabdariffa TaxID=183260 RepID=A0ABR2FES8_9ROSI